MAQAGGVPIHGFRGFLSDLFFCLLLAYLLSYVAKGKEKAVIAVGVLSALFYAANHDHILYNNAHIDFLFLPYALTKTFVVGSVLAPGVWIKASVCVALVVGALRLVPKDFEFGDRVGKGTVGACLILLIVLGRAGAGPSGAPWMANGVVEENLANLLNHNSREHVSAKKSASAYFEQNLEGELLFPTPESQPNVLLVIVEGMGIEHVAWMPELTSLLDEALVVPQFVAHQRQTNRGLYALLYGDYPNFISRESKSDHLVNFPSPITPIPARLRDAGYQTLFIQAAPLDFMRKDLFAEKAGFSDIQGYRKIAGGLAQSSWGVDDHTLLSHTLRHLESVDSPWFATLLTVGTHPPYNIPAAERTGGKTPTKEDAYRSLDKAVAKIWRERQDVMLIITSDEVASDRRRGAVDDHLGFLIVRVPGGKGVESEEIFMQADLPLSLADLLKLPTDGYIGRSVFRRYNQPRKILMGNIYTKKLMALNSSGWLIETDHRFDRGLKKSFNQFGDDLPYGDEVPAAELFHIETQFRANDQTTRSLESTILFRQDTAVYSGRSAVLLNHITEARAGQTVSIKGRCRSDGDLTLTIDLLEMAGNAKVKGALLSKRFDLGEDDDISIDEVMRADRDIEWIYINIRVSGDPARSLRIDDLVIEKRD
jgi:hypothetical protein